MIKRVNISEDILKLIPLFYLQQEGDNKIVLDKTHMFCLGNHLLEDMALALGLQDECIKGTENDPEGRAFSEEATERMLSLHQYLKDNFLEIESSIHQFAVKGGVTEGQYVCKDYELIWHKADAEKRTEECKELLNKENGEG